jgi:peptidyl-prolyl cis-trans isomerase C
MFYFPSPRALAALLPALALAGAAAAANAPQPAGNPVVARVDGIELHKSDVEAERQTLPPQAQQMALDKIYPLLLDRLVNNTLVTEAARKQHLEQDPEVQKQLKKAEDQLVERAYLTRAIEQATTPEALKARYQTWIKDKKPGEEVHARHILVKTEDEAKTVVAQLEKGADFEALAKKYSTDPGAASGGDLGWFSREEMVPEFAEAAFALPKGQFTKTPIKTQFGWHVIQVLDRRSKAVPTYAEAEPEMRTLVARDVVTAKLAELHKNAKIETFDLNGKPMALPKKDK